MGYDPAKCCSNLNAFASVWFWRFSSMDCTPYTHKHLFSIQNRIFHLIWYKKNVYHFSFFFSSYRFVSFGVKCFHFNENSTIFLWFACNSGRKQLLQREAKKCVTWVVFFAYRLVSIENVNAGDGIWHGLKNERQISIEQTKGHLNT